MVRKLKKLLLSNLIRRYSILMSCALILFSCFSLSVGAFMIDDTANTNYASILSGTMTLHFYPLNGDEVSDTVSCTYDIGGMLPYPPVTGNNYYGQYDEDYLLSSSASPEWDIYSTFRIARYKSVINDYSFDRTRFNVDCYESGDSENGKVFYNQCDFAFNPFFFYENYNESVLSNLFSLRLSSSVVVDTSVSYSYLHPLGFLSTKTESVSFTGGHSNIEVYSPLADIATVISEDVDPGGTVFITGISVSLHPSSAYSSLSGASFELLSEQWSSAKPRYIYLDNGIYASPQASSRYFSQYCSLIISEIRDSVGSAGGDPVSPEIGGFFTRFLASSVSGFFDAEIMPGFSIGGVVTALLAVVLCLLLLKFFSGG